MSIFNEFPYTNFHEMNLDWILEKTKEMIDAYLVDHADLHDLRVMYNGLKRYVENYFSDLDVQNEINNKLDEMYENGQLENVVNRTRSYLSQERGWVVRQIGNTYTATINLTHRDIGITAKKIGDVPYAAISGILYLNLPMPLRTTAVLSQPISHQGVGTNAAVNNNATLQHRMLFFDQDILNNDTLTVTDGITVTGRRALVPETPRYAEGAGGAQAIACAKSYYDARLAGRLFSYGPNFITYANNIVVNNSGGAAMMECDTLVALCMMGIDYEHSPYANTTPGYTYNFDDLVVNPNNYSWTLPWKYNDIVRRQVTYTGLQCWWFWDNNMVFSDMSQLKTGDIAMFRRPAKSTYFDNIGHIGMIDVKQDGTPWIYHITDAGVQGSVMAYEPLQNLLDRKGYSVKDGTMYFARPNYGA